MTAINPTQAAFLTQDPTAKWLLEQFPFPLTIAKVFPFIGVDGGTLSVPSTGAMNPAEIVPATANVSTLDQTAVPVATDFFIGYYFTRYELEYSAQDGFKFPNDIDEAQGMLAVRRLLYAFFRGLENGVSTYPTPPGVYGLLNGHGGQIKSAGTPGTFSLTEFYESYHLIVANDGRPNAIMSTKAAQLDYINACVAAGINLEYVDFEWDDPIKGKVKAPILSVLGTPWYINGALTEDDNIFFMVLGFNGQATTGRGITGIVPSQLLRDMFVRRKMPATYEDVGASTYEMFGKESISYSWPVGVAVGSPGALSIYTGF